jgi:hypothetical protein
MMGDDYYYCYYYYEKNNNNLFIYLTAELNNQLPNNIKIITVQSKKRPPLIPQNITIIYQNRNRRSSSGARMLLVIPILCWAERRPLFLYRNAFVWQRSVSPAVTKYSGLTLFCLCEYVRVLYIGPMLSHAGRILSNGILQDLTSSF